jgi:hypothetical protein
MDYQVNVKNYSFPISSVSQNIYKYFDTDKYKILEYMIQKDQVFTDEGFLLTDINGVDFFKLDEFSIDTTNYDPSTRQLMSCFIYASNKSNLFYRKYIKISEIVASLGGLIKVFPLIFSVLNLTFSRINRYNMMIEEIFDFDLKEESILSKQTKIQKIEVIKNSNSKQTSSANIMEFTNNSNTSSKNLPLKEKKSCTSTFFKPNLQLKSTIQHNQEVLEQIIEIVNKKNKTCELKFSFFETLKISFGCILFNNHGKEFRRKLLFYNLGKGKIMEYFDIINLVRILEEFERLKKIMLTKNQLSIFQLNKKQKLSDEPSLPKTTYKLLEIPEQIIEINIREFLNKFAYKNNTHIDDALMDQIWHF